jgi:hypothetical protein
MSASTLPPAASPCFSEPELAMLAKTADALSAYLGKPVLAQVSQTDSGAEWVAFGVPIEANAPKDDHTHVQLGGADARLLGNRGGLPLNDVESYDCVYLWAIEITTGDGERFVKLDDEGEESAWSDDLVDVLPFALSDDELHAVNDIDEDEDDDDGEDEDDDIDDDPRMQFPADLKPPLRRH